MPSIKFFNFCDLTDIFFTSNAHMWMGFGYRFRFHFRHSLLQTFKPKIRRIIKKTDQFLNLGGCDERMIKVQFKHHFIYAYFY